MNIKQAKEKYTLQSLLSILGHTCDPKKSRGSDLWYKSPFRPNEHTPSFHIDAHNDFYKDFGDADNQMLLNGLMILMVVQVPITSIQKLSTRL